MTTQSAADQQRTWVYLGPGCSPHIDLRQSPCGNGAKGTECKKAQEPQPIEARCGGGEFSAELGQLHSKVPATEGGVRAPGGGGNSMVLDQRAIE